MRDGEGRNKYMALGLYPLDLFSHVISNGNTGVIFFYRHRTSARSLPLVEMAYFFYMTNLILAIANDMLLRLKP